VVADDFSDADRRADLISNRDYLIASASRGYVGDR
jgi:hypothetical protein